MMKRRPHWNFSSAQNPITFTAISRSVVKYHHERRQARCMYHFIVKKNATQSRSLSFFRYRRMRYVGSYNSQTDRPKSSTLQRIPTIFNQREVISVTFDLSRIPFNNIRVSRLLQFSGGAKLPLRSKANRKKFKNKFVFLTKTENRKSNAKPRKIRKPKCSQVRKKEAETGEEILKSHVACFISNSFPSATNICFSRFQVYATTNPT